MSDSSDPSVIRSLAITAGDVVTALERTLRSPDTIVLRVTPPFAGRMRARIHRAGEDEYGDPTPIHVDPATLVSSVPAYPEPEATEDELRSDPTVEYTQERHHERHRRAVEDWRETVRERIVDEATLQWNGDTHRVSVKRLG